jgi:Domain of unknown function (DUF4169)
MPADIVNLNRVRKAKARDAGAKQAVKNRVKFGRTKAEKLQAAAIEALGAGRLDGLKRELPELPPPKRPTE